MSIDLMAPRLLVKINYPNSEYSKGQIINFPDKSDAYTGEMEWQSERVLSKLGGYIMRCIKFFEACPDVFEPIPWWAEREIKDMPEYIKYNNEIDGGSVVKISGIGKWEGNSYISWNSGGGLLISDEFLPATEAEYLQYKANQK